MPMTPRLVSPLLSLVLVSFTWEAKAEREVTTAMLDNGYVSAGFLGLTVGAAAIGAFAITPRLGDRAPLDGLGYRPRSDALERVSDITVGGGMVGSVGLALALESSLGRRGVDRFRAPLILAEGAALASAIIHLTKNLGGVCRPRDWSDERQVCTTVGERGATERARELEAHRSFPSGHTTPLAGMAGAAWGMWLLPSRDGEHFVPLVAATTTLSLAMVALRPLAGAHSWVDTGTGFGVGFASGFAAALLHTTRRESTPSVAASPGPTQVNVSLTF